MIKKKHPRKSAHSKRFDWDKFWFLIAMAYSTRGPCDRLHTACLIVKDKRLVGAGYNCSVAGLGHCNEVGHLIIDGHCERTLHAEENAILNTERRHIKGADVYLLGTPCLRCLKLLANAGVKNVFYIGSYDSVQRSYSVLPEIKKVINVKRLNIDPYKLWEEAERFLKSRGGILRKR